MRGGRGRRVGMGGRGSRGSEGGGIGVGVMVCWRWIGTCWINDVLGRLGMLDWSLALMGMGTLSKQCIHEIPIVIIVTISTQCNEYTIETRIVHTALVSVPWWPPKMMTKNMK